MPSSTKWRLNITASNHASFIGLMEATMSSGAGGADLCTGGTATASSQFSATYGAAKAFDNSTGSYWSTASGVTAATLQYEFAAPVTITAYSIQANGTVGNPEGFGAPKDWTLDYWDGSAWQVFDTVTGQTGWYGMEIRSFPLVTKQRWRLHVIAASVASPNSSIIAELQLRIAVAGANQATSVYQARASTEYNSLYLAGNALDGNAATVWSSTGTAYPHDWYYWFAGATDIAEYVIKAGDSTFPPYAPKTWTLDYWNGTAWVTVDTRTDQAVWTTSESRTFAVAPSDVLVPDVVTDLEAAASATLLAAGLTVGTVTYIEPTARIVAQSPAAGATATLGSAVNLDRHSFTAGEVVSQSPVAGTLVAPGTAVNLVVVSTVAPRVTQLTVETLTKAALPPLVIQTTPPVNGTGSTISATFTTPPLLGSGLIIYVNHKRTNPKHPATGVSDNHGNPYLLAAVGSTNQVAAAIYYCPKVIATGAPFTITFDAGQGLGGIYGASAMELGGVGSALGLAQATGRGGTSATTTPSTGPTPPVTVPNALACALVCVNGGLTSLAVESVTPAWSTVFEELTSTSSTAAGEGDARLLTGITGTTQSCSWTLSNNRTYAAALALFIADVVDNPPATDATLTQFVVETLSPNLSDPRVSQLTVETLTKLVADPTITQFLLETATDQPPSPLRVSQSPVELVEQYDAPLIAARLSQAPVETIEQFEAPLVEARLSQAPVETLQQGASAVVGARVSQAVLEIIYPFGCYTRPTRPCVTGEFPIDDADSGGSCPTGLLP